MKKNKLIPLLVVLCLPFFSLGQDHYNKFYYANGQVKGEGSLDSLNQFNGVWTFYHENGMKKSNGSYVHGKANGCWFFWLPDGKLNDYGWYKNDKLDSTWYFSF